MKDDTISRQALLDTVDLLNWYHQNKNGEMVHGANSDEHQAWYKAEDIYKAIESVPSAQPTDRNGQERTGTDLISRQAALDALGEEPLVWYDGEDEIAERNQWRRDVAAIKALPSAQPVVISKSENATECEDAVSREAVLNEIHRYMEERDYTIGLLDDNVCGLPPVTPKQPEWIPCTPETMPDNEQDVLVTVEIRPVGRKPFRRVVRAFYTDGKHTDADSAYTWYELEEPDFDDDGNIIVPEGWWESSDYSEEVSQIDDFVISWREQPQPWEGGQDGKN